MRFRRLSVVLVIANVFWILFATAALARGMGVNLGRSGWLLSDPDAISVPARMNYQGYLETSDGVPVDGAQSVTFRVCDSSVEGDCMWAETHSVVTFADGRFSATLGSAGVPLPSGVFTDAARWIELSVGGEVLTPRLQFASVPYAFNAARLNGKTEAEILSSAGGGLPSGSIIFSEDPADSELLAQGFVALDQPGQDISTWSPIYLPEPLRYLALVGEHFVGSGWCYDLKATTWTTMSMTGGETVCTVGSGSGKCPAAGSEEKMYVWGGAAVGNYGYLSQQGGIYDVPLDSWSAMDESTAPSPRAQHALMWTGERLIVWGGAVELDSWGVVSVFTNTGSTYDPAADTWYPMSTVGAPMPDSETQAVWSGTEMLVWTGAGAGARYDPATDTWQAISTEGAPGASTDFRIAALGSNLYLAPVSGAGPLMRYNVASSQWELPSMRNGPLTPGKTEPFMAAVGEYLFVFGGYDWETDSGGVYDPASDRWLGIFSGRLPTLAYDRYLWRFATASDVIVCDDTMCLEITPRFAHPYEMQ